MNINDFAPGLRAFHYPIPAFTSYNSRTFFSPLRAWHSMMCELARVARSAVVGRSQIVCIYLPNPEVPLDSNGESMKTV